MRRLGNKGISPLIATVLLIAFAVALGAVVMNLSQGYIVAAQGEPRSAAGAQSRCSDAVRLGIFEAKGVRSLCFDGSTLKYRLVNVGVLTVDNVRVQVVGSASVDERMLGTVLQPADIKDGSVPYSTEVHGAILAVKFVPQAGGEFCPQNALEFDDVPSC